MASFEHISFNFSLESRDLDNGSQDFDSPRVKMLMVFMDKFMLCPSQSGQVLVDQGVWRVLKRRVRSSAAGSNHGGKLSEGKSPQDLGDFPKLKN